ncbi:hypothetical protein PLESTF_001502000 [Pleodorina starrii]|nr:hypothetical protein PLESTM_001696400 [Pleodorina starrii]GLC74346.1 hypothetical protein PLESTF_001502000 [Pleodorina starrii]
MTTPSDGTGNQSPLSGEPFPPLPLRLPLNGLSPIRIPLASFSICSFIKKTSQHSGSSSSNSSSTSCRFDRLPNTITKQQQQQQQQQQLGVSEQRRDQRYRYEGSTKTARVPLPTLIARCRIAVQSYIDD